MATMRPYLQRIQLSWIAFWIVGTLCGALLMLGVSTLRNSSHDSTALAVGAQNVQESNRSAVINGDSSNHDRRADRIQALGNRSRATTQDGTRSTGSGGLDQAGTQRCYSSSTPIGPGERDLFASGSLLSETCHPAGTGEGPKQAK